MFQPQLWNADDFVSSCQENQFMTPQFNWALDSFGGRNPNKDFKEISNIVFTNGDLDPWRAGGLTHTIPGNTNI
jgi:hypothetical protein